MAVSRLGNAVIRGVVTAVPGEPVAVADLPVDFPRSEIGKIAKVTGLGRLHRASANQTAADLSFAAAETLLDRLGWDAGSIGALINVTQTPDVFSPATACILHGRLGLNPDCLAFDVNISCSGYIYGLLLGWQFIGSGTAKRVIVTAGDTLGKTVSPGDKATAVLFGDAASATAIEYDEAAEQVVFVTGTDGTGSADLCIPAGGWRWPIDDAALAAGTGDDGNVRAPRHIYMDGLAVFNFTLKRVPELVRRVTAEAGFAIGAADAFFLHQANAFILKTLANKMGIPGEKIPVNIGQFGNTSMASIPLLLTDDSRCAWRGNEPLRVVMAGFGAGFSWAALAGVLKRPRVLEHIQVPDVQSA